ncbi:secreted RxLR effector protein 161-like [Amaranthus tricolor]|uniref:secreted RxLR effector protein 161-like n=1 Tax=Amaranthus tricolor TaxID=29722 RepID=UPI00258AFF37|nr:secreted RxLR effector protein 161-like [Amaranthus tricolor]
MDDAKGVPTPLASYLKLSKRLCPQTKAKEEQMVRIPYTSAVGSVMYAMVCSRPDIAHAVSLVSRYMSNPGKGHWEALKWLLRYLKSTSNVCLMYGKDSSELIGFHDLDYGGDLDNRKSTSGFVFTLSGSAVSWQSSLQDVFSLSTTEAKYIAVAESFKEVKWVKGLVGEMCNKDFDYMDPLSEKQVSNGSVGEATRSKICGRKFVKTNKFDLGYLYHELNYS